MPTSVTTERGGSCTVACGTTTRPLIEPVGAGALARAGTSSDSTHDERDDAGERGGGSCGDHQNQ